MYVYQDRSLTIRGPRDHYKNDDMTLAVHQENEMKAFPFHYHLINKNKSSSRKNS